MKYRLRTLLIVLCVSPLVIAAAYWALWPEPGSPAEIKRFERALASGSRARIEWATSRCFAPGVPAKRYDSLFAKAATVHRGDGFASFPKTAKVYEFPGGGSSVEGDCGVFVAVDGDPLIIVEAQVSTYMK